MLGTNQAPPLCLRSSSFSRSSSRMHFSTRLQCDTDLLFRESWGNVLLAVPVRRFDADDEVGVFCPCSSDMVADGMLEHSARVIARCIPRCSSTYLLALPPPPAQWLRRWERSL